MNKHTPTPWKFETHCLWGGANLDRYAAGVGTGIPRDEQVANGEFIERAVNCHADLLAALERIAAVGGPFTDNSHSPYWAIGADDLAACHAAIAKAKGE